MLNTSRMVTFSTPFPFFYLCLIILPSFKTLKDPLRKALVAALTSVSFTQLRVCFNQEYLSPGWSLEPGQRTNPFWAQLCIFRYFLTNRLGGISWEVYRQSWSAGPRATSPRRQTPWGNQCDLRENNQNHVVFHSLLFSEALPKHLRGKQKGHSCPAVHAGESSVPWMDRGRQSAGSLR